MQKLRRPDKEKQPISNQEIYMGDIFMSIEESFEINILKIKLRMNRV
jgi:hypothetical protein